MAQQLSVAPLPFIYKAFFLYIEPVATAVGAYYAWFQQDEYMRLTYSTPADVLGVSTREHITLLQLANLYLVFAINEALVLRATNDLKVWRIFLVGLLIADFGHLWSVHALGWPIYYQFWTWNSIHWGNLGFVYVGASMRMAFLSGLGLASSRSGAGGKRKKVR
ncbi:hypothetical protein KC318_g11903 [Hortaea werneckii]|uniref:DUF7704 domain-containing protein n=1 Tax=Hortaea werneckii TaxID=91943 RepID=A0A3M7BFP9_HORWE|nr:hypothetical protein KC334_g11843 [Hortaea werneckii]KAI6968302.1 hypothetical protein KC355_g11987 [Hortaea werneckii]KAI7203749.1 hypothetical protein KC324_g1105 [Hortaea werneckii]KAI7594471.1 hypothetical protein KC316_g1099 [Hortaea werneckii]KAI7657258.1 hypothetical protein KC318_g11903 [Hortaea werneckii]